MKQFRECAKVYCERLNDTISFVAKRFSGKVVVLSAILMFFLGNIIGIANSADDITKNFVRFHIIANSNSERDQWVKQEIRRRIFESLDLSHISSKEDAILFFKQNRDFVEKLADEVLLKNGFHYQSNVTIGAKQFPIREYSDFVLPAGVYDSVTVTLGTGEGENFFCVMYPSLCMIEGVKETTASNSEILHQVLTEHEAETVCGSKKVTVMKFKIAELISKCGNALKKQP